MNIGILTYHRSHNYGALLQAIALRRVISEMGYDVKFVDYWPEYHRKMYSLIDHDKFTNINGKQKIKFALFVLLTLPFKYLRILKFRKFIKENIQPYCSSVSSTWDMIICGSDQIWRKQPRLGNKFNPEYFGSGEIKSDKYMSYAASMGSIDMEESELPELIGWLSKFKCISVREESLSGLLKKGGLINATTVLDPTLLLTKEEWSSIIGSTISYRDKDKYLLVYDFQKGSFDLTAIKKFAKQNGLRTVILRGEVSKDSFKHDIISIADPYEMARMIREAEIVFTSSYHGLVFSILFERQFVASFINNSDRAQSLLNQIELTNRLIPARSTHFPTNTINFVPVVNKLKILKNQSLDWLKRALIQQSN